MNDNTKLCVCGKCAVSVKKIPSEHCPVCGSVTELGDSVCWSCSNNKIPFKSHRSVYVYRDKAKRAVINLKFRGKRHYADTMGQLMSVYAPKSGSFDVVTFVPMTRKAVRKRRYNQAELLAGKIAEIIGKECKPCLKKIKETKEQSRLGFKKRLKNVAGAFVGLENVSGMKVLLVDDVYTTGSTMTAAAKALKNAGAVEVNCLSFAMTQRRKNEE